MLQHCEEKLSLLIVIALGLWRALSLFKVIDLGSKETLSLFIVVFDNMTKVKTGNVVTF
jgi:hypothetical protein